MKKDAVGIDGVSITPFLFNGAESENVLGVFNGVNYVRRGESVEYFALLFLAVFYFRVSLLYLLIPDAN